MRLSRLNMPVLLIQSTHLDENFTWRSLQPGMSTPWTRLVLSEVPRARLQIVTGRGHFVQIEAAAEVNRHIGTFKTPHSPTNNIADTVFELRENQLLLAGTLKLRQRRSAEATVEREADGVV